MSFNHTEEEWNLIKDLIKPGQSWADVCEEEDLQVNPQENPIPQEVSNEWITVKKVVRKQKPKTENQKKEKCYFFSIGKCHFGKNCKNIH